MQHASIEFVRFGASDVIATSATANLWALGSTLSEMFSISLSSAIGVFPAGQYEVRLNGVPVSDDGVDLYHISPNYTLSLSDTGAKLGLFGVVVDSGEARAAFNDETDVIVGAGAANKYFPLVLKWLDAYGHLLEQ